MNWFKGSATGRGWSRRSRRIVPLLIASVAIMSGVALAATAGLVNSGFEQGSGNQLDGWTLKAYDYDEDTGLRTQVYGPGMAPVPCDDQNAPGFSPYGVCVVNGDDHFDTYDFDDEEFTGRTVAVLEGNKMVRLGGPFTHPAIDQSQDGLAIEQTFTVSAENPVVDLNYNIATFDSPEYDELALRVKLTSAGEPTITERLDVPNSDENAFRLSGWKSSDFDLTSYVGQTVKLEIVMRGTRDNSVPTWAYIDAVATAPPVVDPPIVDPPIVDPPVSACASLKGNAKIHCGRVLACKKLSGKKRSHCLKLVKRRKQCLPLKGKKKSACEKKAAALSKCDRLKGKPKKKCVKKARKIKVK